jgi:predicted regulator of Ras-like GTPase activity (Roadblock/LC7/MglB family)
VTEASSKPLQTVIDEFRNISPELSKAFIFKKDGENIASSEDRIAQDRAKRIAAAFENILNQAGVIDGIEILTIQGISTQIDITSTNNSYLATVSSRAADEKMIRALNCVIVPTIIRLMDQIATPATSDQPSSDIEETEIKQIEEVAQPPEPTVTQQFPVAPEASSQQIYPKPPVNQFLVEKIGGLLVASDMVRVDADVVAKWSDLYDNMEILQVNVETLEGKSVLCRFRPIRDSDGKAKGVIQIPERIIQTLGTSEGRLVMVKPVVPAPMEEKS